MTREMKDSGVEWIGEIPVDWNIKRNKQLFVEVNDRCENGNEHSLLSVSEYYGIAPKSEKVSDGEFETRAESLDGYKLCKVEDIVMNIMLAWKRSTGRSAYDGIVSPAYCVYRKKADIDTRYYHYLFRTDIVADLFKRYSTGIIDSRLRLYPDKFMSLNMIVPPCDEQCQIAEYLDQQCAYIDSVIEKTKVSIEEYKKLKQAIITQAITKGVRDNREMKDSGIEWIGEIPADWEVVRMKNLGKCRNGLTYSPDNLVPKEEGTLVLRSSNIKDGKLFFVDNVYVNSEIKDDLMVKAGDILICSRNGSRALIGKNALISEGISASFGAFMMIFRCQSPKYVQMILNSAVFSYYLGTFLTSTINQLTADNFNNMKIVYCGDKFEQREIVDYLEQKCAEIDTLIAKKEQIIVELESYKKSIVFDYVTGKKEVP